MDKGRRLLPRALAIVLALGLLSVTFRHVDATRMAALLGHLGPSAALLLVPSVLAICLETVAWRGAFTLLGARTRFSSLIRIRIATESLGAVLPLLIRAWPDHVVDLRRTFRQAFVAANM